MKATKAVATIEPGDDDAESPNGTFAVVLSTPTKDRDGEEVKSEEWEQPLPGHITFDMDHGMSVATTVGSGVPAIEDGNLIVRGTYSSRPLAQEVRGLVNEGHIRTTSVAFLRKSSKDEKGIAQTKRELLNGAFVAIPANKEAVVLGSKGTSVELDDDEIEPVVTKAGARHSAADAAIIQQIHDLAARLGATAQEPDADDMAAGKSGEPTEPPAAAEPPAAMKAADGTAAADEADASAIQLRATRIRVLAALASLEGDN